jgi:single-strand DNA-binding protein
MGSNGVNKVILIGNLGADPDMRHTQSGASVCELRLATNRTWTDKNNQKQEEVEWHRVVCWAKLAERCAKYLRKGSSIYLEGRLRTRKWETKDGDDRYTTEVIANDVQFLSNWGNDSGVDDRSRTKHEEEIARGQSQDDLPF